MKAIRIADVTGVRKGKPVLLVTATRADAFQAAPDSRWEVVGGRQRDEWPRWRHGQTVQAVTHYNAHRFAVGDLLEIKDIGGQVVAHAEIGAIQMAEPGRFTDVDFAQMRYASREAYLADWGQVLGERVWQYHVRYLREEELHDHDQPG